MKVFGILKRPILLKTPVLTAELSINRPVQVKII